VERGLQEGPAEPDVVSMSVGDTGAFFTSARPRCSSTARGPSPPTRRPSATSSASSGPRPRGHRQVQGRDGLQLREQHLRHEPEQEPRPRGQVHQVPGLGRRNEDLHDEDRTFSSTKSIPTASTPTRSAEDRGVPVEGNDRPFIENVTSKQVEHEWLRLNPWPSRRLEPRRACQGPAAGQPREPIK